MAFFNFGRKKNPPKKRPSRSDRPSGKRDSSETVLSEASRDLLKRSFCMWKPTKNDPDFSKSRIINLIGALFDAVNGYELAAHKRMSAATKQKILKEIPEMTDFSSPVIANLGKNSKIVFVFSLCKDKGLRYYFNYEKTSPEKIEKFLESELSRFKTSYKKKTISSTEGRLWWRRLKFVYAKSLKEEGGKLKAIGQIGCISKDSCKQLKIPYPEGALVDNSMIFGKTVVEPVNVGGLYKTDEGATYAAPPGNGTGFCMWKSTKEDPNFSKSPIVKLIDQVFDLVDGRELEAHFVMCLMTLNIDKILTKIPDDIHYLLNKDTSFRFVFSLSKKQGLRLYFNYEKYSRKQIEEFLKTIISIFKGARINTKNSLFGFKWDDDKKLSLNEEQRKAELKLVQFMQSSPLLDEEMRKSDLKITPKLRQIIKNSSATEGRTWWKNIKDEVRKQKISSISEIRLRTDS